MLKIIATSPFDRFIPFVGLSSFGTDTILICLPGSTQNLAIEDIICKGQYSKTFD